MVKSSSGKNGLRSFAVVGATRQGACKTKSHRGRYLGRSPAAAARKAFTELCRVKRIRGVCTLFVTVQETTQGSSHKVFTYKLSRLKLKTPLIMMEGTDNEYVIEYEVKAKSTGAPKDCANPGQSRGRAKKRTARRGRKSPNNVRRLKSKRS
jgi:hypothetical protein